jgi:glycosyltransferase involved in cell wall biosynthesis
MLSFIVPAYNEELELPATIAAIRAAADKAAGSGNAGLPGRYEIVVVNDGSTDATAEVATKSGARVVAINRRQIAASRNAGARAACGDILFFVDADTHIAPTHILQAIELLKAGWAGGGARVAVGDRIPLWGRVATSVFCTLYFGLNLGAGAFLFTTQKNFQAIGGFDETLFIGEEIFFSRALKKLGRFKILSRPVVTSGRKLRIYSAGEIFSRSFAILIRGMRAARSREKLDFWYNGKREAFRPRSTRQPKPESVNSAQSAVMNYIHEK